MAFRLEEELNVEDRDSVYLKYQHFPSRLITSDEDHVPVFVIGTGGDGKTFNELIEAIEWYLNPEIGIYNLSGFFYPTKSEVEEIIAGANLFDKLLGEEETAEKYGDFISQITYNKDWIYHDGKPFVRLFAISMHAKYKPQDHTRIGNIWMDEFQRERYLTREAFKTQDLISTIKRKKPKDKFRCVFTSNAISLAAPILQSMGIFDLDKHSDYVDEEGIPDYSIVTPIYSKRDVLKAKVIYWKRPDDQVMAQYENDDPYMEWFEESGYAEYRYKNKFKNDSLTNIQGVIEDDELKEFAEYKHTFKTQDIFVDVWYIPAENNSKETGIYYFKKRDKVFKDKDVAYALNQEDADDTTLFRPMMSEQIARRLQRNKLEYDTIATKQAVWETVKRWF